MYYAAIGALAILILLIVNQDILFSPSSSFERAAWNVYRKFLYAVGAFYVTDTAWGILEALGLTAALFADTTLYFVFMGAGVLLWCEFVVAYLEDVSPFGRLIVGVGRIIAALICLLAVTNVFVPVLFTFDASGAYLELPARSAMLAFQVVLLLLISTRTLSSMLNPDTPARETTRYRIMTWFGLIMATFLSAQLWFPYLPLYTIAYMLGTCMLHTFVASDEKEEHQRSLHEAATATELKETIVSLLNNMPGMAFTKDATTGVYLASNQAFAEYAHKDGPEGVVGLTDAEIFDPETAAHFVNDDRVALSISVPYIFFEDVADAAGNRRQLQTTKLKYTDSSGRLCVLGMCQDVTDLVRIQHENVLTKEAYEKAVSSGVIYTHIAQTLARDYTDLYYVHCDTEEYVEYAHVNGNTLSEIRRGWHFFSDCKEELASQVHPDDRDAFLATMRRKALMAALDSPSMTVVLTYRQLTDDGARYVRGKVSRMADDEHYIIFGTTDIDAETRDAIAKGASLAEALAQVEAAREQRISYLSIMSHEIRSPINTIIGLGALALRKDDMTPQTREHLLRIDESARSLLRLINEILDLGRIEGGRMVLSTDSFGLSALVSDLGAAVSPVCRDRSLNFSCHVDTDAYGTYVGDQARLHDALASMLSYAARATTEGGTVTLTVKRSGEPDPNDDRCALHLVVQADEAIIDDRSLVAIFEPFSGSTGAAVPKNDTGLGMALAKQVVELMGGSVHVSTKEQGGVRFDVTVLLAVADQKDAKTDPAIDVSALRVLVVDDNAVEVEHARTVLEEAGVKADVATGGEEALSMLGNARTALRPYNLVLMDWSMPGMSGLEASREIRSRYGDEAIVVAMTSYSWDDIQSEAHGAGVDTYLAKPLSPVNVTEQLERIALKNERFLSGERRRADLAGRTVLLAEDMEINADIMIDTLELDGIKADHARNGRIAVDMFQESEPGTYAAILMDVRMPEMDGLEATRTIRSMDRPDARRIPIIALTANAFDEDVERSLGSGMNAHLMKPVESTRLIQLLGELVFEAEASA